MPGEEGYEGKLMAIAGRETRGASVVAPND